MKKLSAILVALVLVAATAVTAFAAGINSSEQAVLDELKTSVAMKGGEMVIPTEYVNQAENYFNTIEMTEAQSKDIIAVIQEGKNFLKNSGAANISDLTFAQKQELLAYGEKAVAVLDMTMSYDKTTKKITILDPNGEVAFSASPALSKGGSASGSGNGTGNVVENPIKTTGSDVNYFGFIVLGAAAVVLVAGGTMFVVKTKKERA